MLGDISRAEHIYIAVGYTDMRKQIDSLSALVTAHSVDDWNEIFPGSYDQPVGHCGS